LILPDVNLLLYAYNNAAPEHDRAAAWLSHVLGGTERVAFSWTTVLGFLRLITNRQIFPTAMAVADAIAIVNDWLAQPNFVFVEPGDRHWGILADLIVKGQVRGPMITDAHIAALAIEHGAELHTGDRDFTRFPGLRIRNPLEL
jgi:toxin-antitoxin system PIN domain toxin